MSSIIKVDTIQNQSGANIISESSNTITVGASGDTITVPSGATLGGAGTVDLSSATVTLNDSMKMTPAFSVDLSSNQAISDQTETKLAFSDERFDTDGAFDASTNYRFTVPTGQGGKYFLAVQVTTNYGGTSVYARMRFYKNGSWFRNAYFGNLGVAYSHCMTDIVTLAAGDYIETYYWHNRGSNENIIADTGTYFAGYKLIGV